MGPIRRENLHDQITRKLGLAILSGELKDGDVSSEQSLCQSLGVSRTVLRESIKVLVSKGLLTVRPKVGVSIRPRKDWNLFDPDVLAWQSELVVDEEFLRALCEVRLIVEPAGAALAAVRATPEERALISSCFRSMELNINNKPEYDEADIAFHGAIFDACHNALLRQLGKTIRAALALQDRSGGESGVDESLALHREVAVAVCEGNETAARVAMENVIFHAARLVYRGDERLSSTDLSGIADLTGARSLLKQVLHVLERHAGGEPQTEPTQPPRGNVRSNKVLAPESVTRA